MQNAFVKGQDSSTTTVKENEKVSFLTQIDINHATKDGIYLNGYVVSIPYERINELNGKTVRISGKVTIVKGISDDAGGQAKQGRQDDTKHILRPRIRIIKD